MSNAPMRFPKPSDSKQAESKPSNKSKPQRRRTRAGKAPKMQSGNHEFFYFNSMAEVADYLELMPVLNGNISTRDRSSFAPLNYKDCLAIMRKGGAWPEGVKNLQAVKVPAFSVMRQVEAMLIESAVNGFAPNVGAYLANLPDAMLNSEEGQQTRPVLRLEICCSCSSHVQAESVLNRGRALVAIIKALEAQGVSVELKAYSMIMNKQRTNGQLTNFLIKKATDPLNVSVLAFVLCNVSFLRSVVTGFIERSQQFNYMASTNYGYPSNYPSGAADVHMGFMCSEESFYCDTPEKATQYVLRQIKPFIDSLTKRR